MKSLIPGSHFVLISASVDIANGVSRNDKALDLFLFQRFVELKLDAKFSCLSKQSISSQVVHLLMFPRFLENISQIPISIFKMDLPNLRRQPSYETLCRVLNELEVLPSSWGSSTRKSSIPADNAAVLMFLMSVISNDLYWLEDSTSGEDKPLSAHNHKEILLDLASKRVAERCGRSGKPQFHA